MSDLEERCKEAVKRFKGLPPEQQRAIREAQRKSWVIGELMIEHPDMSRGKAERLWRGGECGFDHE